MGLGDRDYYRPRGFGGFSFFPPVIKTLLIINVAVFVVMILSAQISISGPVTLYDYIMKYFALIPIGGGGIYIQGVGKYLPASFLPWQLITYQFMHDISGFSHIFFNMLMLWMFGIEIENIWGSKKFLFFYLLSGLGGGIANIFLAGSGAPTIGASGAVFGIMVAFAMFFPNRYIFLYFLIPIKAKYLMAILVVFEFMSVGDMTFVAHIVHIGGALTALAFILLDRTNHFDIEGFARKLKNLFNSASPGKGGSSGFSSSSFKRKSSKREIQDAEFFDIGKEEKVDQAEIDRILDKISQSGYQNLTEREKKVLFEASKKN